MVDPSYLEAVCEEAPVDLYNAAYMVKCDYPYRIEELENSSPTVAEKASKYLLDSKINAIDVSNTEILDRGAEINAQRVVPKDYMPFESYDDREMDTDERDAYLRLRRRHDTHVEATLASLETFLEAYPDHEFDGSFAVPLQRDHYHSYEDSYDKSVALLEEYGYDTDRMYLIGGVKDAQPLTQFDAAVDLRDHVGDDVHLHGLGMGTSLEWARAFREFPGLLDSVDNMTAMHMAKTGRIYDTQVDGHNLNIPRGTHSSTLIAHLLEWNLLIYNYIMTDLARETDLAEIFADVDIGSFRHAYDGETQSTLPRVVDD